MKSRKLILCIVLSLIVGLFNGFSLDENIIFADSNIVPNIKYKVQMQSIGWEKNYVSDGVLSGTVGKAKRLEAIRIKLVDNNGNKISSSYGSVLYKTHIQKQGWESSFKKNDEISGTVGKSLRLEAIQIKLSGTIASQYDIYYQVQAQKFGWLGWAKNGENAGTAGYALRLEAIKIKLIKKGSTVPSSSLKAYYDKNSMPVVAYKTQIQTTGWENKYATNGMTSGTVGKAKRLEAIKIYIQKNNSGFSGGVTYRTHVQKLGWQSFVSNDEISGTVGKALRLEAIQIKFTGNLANYFDIYYRVQAQKLGWMGWAKNGESAGTSGYGYRLEAIQIQPVIKGMAAPGTTSNAYCVLPTTLSTSVERKDYSGSFSNYVTINYNIYYDLVKVTNSNYLYKDKINKSIQDVCNEFYNGKGDSADKESMRENLIEFAEYLANDNEASYNETYFWKLDLEHINNSKGYLSMNWSAHWYAGGVGNIFYYSATYDIRTGEKVTLQKVLGMSNEDLLNKITNALYPTWKSSMSYSELKKTVKETFNNNYNFYIDGSGNVYFLYGSYEIATTSYDEVYIGKI